MRHPQSYTRHAFAVLENANTPRILHCFVHVGTWYPFWYLVHFNWGIKSVDEFTSHNATAMIPTSIILRLVATMRIQFTTLYPLTIVSWSFLHSCITLRQSKSFGFITWVSSRYCIRHFRSAHGGYRLFASSDSTFLPLSNCSICLSYWAFIPF